MSDRLAKLAVTGLGAGYMPIAPGTWASAAAAAVYLGLLHATAGNALQAGAVMAGIVVAASIICVALGPFTIRTFGSVDPSQCTIDEWAGQALGLILLPLGAGPRDWAMGAVLAFAIFRLLDIRKFPPAGAAEKLPRGWGILVDDLIAGAYTNIFCQFALRYLFTFRQHVLT